MKKTILYIRSDKHEEFLLGLSHHGDISIQTYHCPIGTMSQQFIPKLELFFKNNRCKLEDIDAIVVYRGPGSYTSLRIGISCANTLAFAQNIPIVGISKQKDFTPASITKIIFTNSFIKPVNPYYHPTPNLPL